MEGSLNALEGSTHLHGVWVGTSERDRRGCSGRAREGAQEGGKGGNLP